MPYLHLVPEQGLTKIRDFFKSGTPYLTYTKSFTVKYKLWIIFLFVFFVVLLSQETRFIFSNNYQGSVFTGGPKGVIRKDNNSNGQMQRYKPKKNILILTLMEPAVKYYPWKNYTRIRKLRYLIPRRLPSSHPCFNFSIPNPFDYRNRACPVCYLPVQQCLEINSQVKIRESEIKELIYTRRKYKTIKHPSFNGFPTWSNRGKSFIVKKAINVHCGFVPKSRGGFDIDEKDLEKMSKCDNIVVASAIFGAFDTLRQPQNISLHSIMTVCFFMFVDEVTYDAFMQNKLIADQIMDRTGIWNIVVVRNLPFDDNRLNGKIPKLLVHRLFPNVKHSIWVDGKLTLIVDPYKILERFLWRGGFEYAISNHFTRHDVFVEAQAVIDHKRCDNCNIREQISFYSKHGLTPFNESKYPIISDVPEGCVIIRQHTLLSNYFSCLWFNEVVRFTPRDQLSFAFVRDLILKQIKFKLYMFDDCQRRNFVVFNEHIPDLPRVHNISDA